MYTPKQIRIPSTLGATLAATLMTIVSAVPDVVHAQGAGAPCAAKLPAEFTPSLM